MTYRPTDRQTKFKVYPPPSSRGVPQTSVVGDVDPAVKMETHLQGYLCTKQVLRLVLA